MKAISLPVAALLLAGSASAQFGGKPPTPPDPNVVQDFLWADPFKGDALADFDVECEAVGSFRAHEFTLHDLMKGYPKGLKAWNSGLKGLFRDREYPGSWEGWDRHLHDRTILHMDYDKVPVEVRNWIETEDRTGGPGKGLFGVFEKPTETVEYVNKTVTFADPGSVDRADDANKVVIFAPGALYHALPLWTAGSTPCREAFMDVGRYKPTPEAGGVVAWLHNTEPKKKEKEMLFMVKAQLLKSKPAETSVEAEASEETAAKEEL